MTRIDVLGGLVETTVVARAFGDGFVGVHALLDHFHHRPHAHKLVADDFTVFIQGKLGNVAFSHFQIAGALGAGAVQGADLGAKPLAEVFKTGADGKASFREGALGAAVQGGKLAGDAGAGDILLLDVTPLSLSIETMGGIATRLIERNTTIPTRKSQIFSTAADNQTAVDINVVQGERQFARDNKSLGQFRLDGIPPARRGVPQIEVTFDIDANGIVNVSAKDLGTGKEQHITITAGSNMSDDEINKAVKEAAEYEAQDKKRKDAVDTKNDADAMVFQTEKAMEEAGDKIDANDKTAVEADLNALKELLAKCSNTDEITDAQVEEIKAGKEKLMQSAQKLFAKMYEQAQAQGGQQAGPGPQGSAGSQDSGNEAYGDDVVDGDYREV